MTLPQKNLLLVKSSSFQSTPEHAMTPPMASPKLIQRMADMRSRRKKCAITAVATGSARVMSAAFEASENRTPQVIKSWATTCPKTPMSMNCITSRLGIRFFSLPSRRSIEISISVDSVMGKKVAATGPICSCTILTSTNWLDQMRLHASSNPQSRRRSTLRLGMLLHGCGLAKIVGQNNFAQSLAAAGHEWKAHFIGAKDTQVLVQRLGVLRFVSRPEQVNEGQDPLRENAQGLSGFSLAKQPHAFLIRHREDGRRDDHATVNAEHQAAKCDHVVARKYRYSVPLQNDDLVQSMVGQLDGLQMLAGIQNDQQLVSTEPCFGVDGIVVEHELQPGRTVQGAEKLQNHWKGVGKVVRAGNQARTDTQILRRPGQADHLVQAGMGQSNHDGF